MLAIIKRAAKIMGDGQVANVTALANAIGCDRSSLYNWVKIPERYRAKIVAATDGKVTLRMLADASK